MAVSKKNTQSKKRSSRKVKVDNIVQETVQPDVWYRRMVQAVLLPIGKLRRRVRILLLRRPHRSFRRTERRDYVRSLKLPGYWSFTLQVRKVLWQNRNTFGLLVIVYG